MVFTQRQGRPTFAATCDSLWSLQLTISNKKETKKQQLSDFFQFDFVVQKRKGSEFHR